MPGLKDTIAGLIKRASSGQVARAKLPRGLNISVLATGNDEFGLQLARDDNYPSQLEWRTVIRAMPTGCETVTAPKSFKYEKMFYLKGAVRLAQQPGLEKVSDA